MQLIIKALFSVFLLCSLSISAIGQTSINSDSIEQIINRQYGIDKLKSLNLLSGHYGNSDLKKALKYARQANQLADAIFTSENVLLNESDRIEKLKAHYQLASVYTNQEKFRLAKQAAQKAADEAMLQSDSTMNDQINQLMSQIDAEKPDKGLFGKKIKPLNIGEKINKSSANLKLSSVLVLAKKQEQLKQYEGAIKQYKMAVNLSRNIGDAQQVAELHVKIGELYQKIDEKEAAAAYYQMASGNFERLSDSSAMASTKQALSEIIQDNQTEIPAVEEFQEDDIQKMDELMRLSKEFERKKNYDLSLKYYKEYQDIKTRLIARQKQLELDSVQLMNQAQEIILLEQENQLNDIAIIQREKEIARQESFRNGLIIGALILLFLVVLFWWLFKTKKKAHQDLTITFNHLNNTRKQLATAELKIKKLLGQQVSEDIATALISEEADKGNIQKFVCVMFLDIRDFTPFASTRTPDEVIQYQNDVFGFMIEIIEKHHGVINQFMGDGFMATFGAPVTYENDVQNAYLAAKAIVSEVNKRSQDKRIPPTKIGIGLHAGNVVAGNVGTDVRKQYSITGTTVITAARIEQLNKKYESQLLISENVLSKLNGETPKDAVAYETQLKGMEHTIKIYKIR